MSEDVFLDPTTHWPKRAEALAQRPAALAEARLQSWPVVVRSEGIDETAILLVDVQHTGESDNAVCVQRQQWLFDEESLRWVLDSNEEWWLPAAVAHRLGCLLSAS